MKAQAGLDTMKTLLEGLEKAVTAGNGGETKGKEGKERKGRN